MQISWRDDKARRNLQKHRLPFALAAEVFADPFAVTTFDRLERGEERWHTIGCIVQGRQFKLILVVHGYPDTDDEAWVQIISLREATTHERRAYETQLRNA